MCFNWTRDIEDKVEVFLQGNFDLNINNVSKTFSGNVIAIRKYVVSFDETTKQEISMPYFVDQIFHLTHVGFHCGEPAVNILSRWIFLYLSRYIGIQKL